MKEETEGVGVWRGSERKTGSKMKGKREKGERKSRKKFYKNSMNQPGYVSNSSIYVRVLREI